MSEWQSINTAPKDGTEVIIYSDYAGVCTAYYDTGDEMWVSSWSGMDVIKFMDCCDIEVEYVGVPLLWQHLPEYPSIEELDSLSEKEQVISDNNIKDQFIWFCNQEELQ